MVLILCINLLCFDECCWMTNCCIKRKQSLTSSPSIICSNDIQSVVYKIKENNISDGLNDAGCTACEMAVVWMKNRLRLNETEDQILDYVNAVKLFFIFMFPGNN